MNSWGGPGGGAMALLTRSDLTPTEQRLCEKAAEGQLLDLRSGEANKDNPAEGTRWGTDRCVRPQLLSQLLTGRGNLDQAFQAPVAVRLRGAKILVRLNLGGLTLRCPLELYQCHLGGRVGLVLQL